MGAMGRVDLVLRRGDDDSPALSVIKRPAADAEPHVKERFQREARIALSLNHPNLARTYEVGVFDGEPGIVQEFVHGVTLQSLGGKLSAPMPVPIACSIVKEVAEALAYAHAQGILHRDIAPENIMIGFNGVVRLIDFGVAKELLPTEPERVLSAIGSTVGRKYFAAPEHLAGQPATKLTDVFSLGVVLWQLLATRDFPFSGTAIRAVPDAPSKSNRAVPPSLDSVSLRAVAFDPAERTESAAELALELTPFTANHPLQAFLITGAHIDLARERALLERDVAAAAAALPPLAPTRHSWRRRYTALAVTLPVALIGALVVRALHVGSPVPGPTLTSPPASVSTAAMPAPSPKSVAPSRGIDERQVPLSAPTQPLHARPPRAAHRSTSPKLAPAVQPAPPVESSDVLLQRALTALRARNYVAAQDAAEAALQHGGGERAEQLLARIKLDRGDK